jgi:hypothetical protein
MMMVQQPMDHTLNALDDLSWLFTDQEPQLYTNTSPSLEDSTLDLDWLRENGSSEDLTTIPYEEPQTHLVSKYSMNGDDAALCWNSCPSPYLIEQKNNTNPVSSSNIDASKAHLDMERILCSHGYRDIFLESLDKINGLKLSRKKSKRMMQEALRMIRRLVKK